MRTIPRIFTLLLFSLVTLPEILFAGGANPKLEPVALGSIETAHRLGTVWLAAQPAREDLAIARELGIRTIISLRFKDEIGWDEEAAVRSLEMRYVNSAFRTPEELTDALLDALRKQLNEADGPVLLHCATGNRVGAVWMAHRILDSGLSDPDALQEAETVGLKNAALRDRVREYVDRSRR
ncbi:MAG TPA: sulfur transferase domain-containing protein [Thermoanaerobaculia bacterium]|nr:sulfur transferase domain-containing protein [Thermoanaerobaculia bacterium]